MNRWPNRIPPDLADALARLDQMRTPPTDQDRWLAIKEWLEAHGVALPDDLPNWPEPRVRF
jgi:hypothetical protein